jgi:hypothetical protein
MRHLRSTLYALVLAPAVWVLCGVGFTGGLVGRAPGSSSIETFTGLLLLVLAGAAYAILLLAPISPAGPGLGGLAFLGASLWALADPSAYADVWPPNVAQPGFDLTLPGYGLAVVLGVPLLCTALRARRWSGHGPPVLPLIGMLGRPRGAASVAGTPAHPAETAVLVTAAPPAEAGPSAASPADAAVDHADDERATTVPIGDAADGARTTVAVAKDDGGRTRVLRLPDPDEITRDLRPDDARDTERPTAEVHADREPPTADIGAHDERPTEDLDRDRTTEDLRQDRTTRNIGPGRPARKSGPDEKTHVIARDPGERTQVIRQSGAVYPMPGESTRPIRAGQGTVDPPGERTQIIRVPAVSAPDPRSTTWTGPASPPSIVGAEQPDPGADPTTRLFPRQRASVEDTTAADRATAAQDIRRPMTVMKMERPPDEVEDDIVPGG